MTVERHFLGWDEPVVTCVRRFLVGDGAPDPDALAGLLLLVPTQQSGRRLRQSLSSYGAAHNVHLGYVRPRLPIDLVRYPSADIKVASSMECMALWTRLLLDTDYSRLTSLFPSREEQHQFGWALATSRLLQHLRHELAATGLTIRRVAADFAETLEEPQRWAELASLEQAYLDLLEATGLVDPGESQLQQANSPRVSEGTTRIVVACAPDADPIALHALSRLAEDYTVQVLIHAPEHMAARFDEWGRPVPAAWQDAVIDIPDVANNLRLASTPADQSRMATTILAEDTFGPLDIGIGVPNTEVIPFLSAEMQNAGMNTYNPEGKPVASHPLFVLLERYKGIVDDGFYKAIASFFRHPDILDHLQQNRNLNTRRLLTDLDEYQNLHLPSDLRSFLKDLGTDERSPRPADAPFPALATGVDYLRQEVIPSDSTAPVASMLAFLRSTFTHRRLSADNAVDAEFVLVAHQLVDILTGYEESCVPELNLGSDNIRTLLIETLRATRYDLPRAGTAIDLEGWLELHWNDAPFVIVTGMNEGNVPEDVSHDPFLPDSLRRQLGLRTDAHRLARDTYIMQALVESRRNAGRACFIAGKIASTGNPLKPSRL
ncbi:MAG: hypothetical protein KAQ74_01760, partial [Dehalococcoidia bacterium]|nr:hypothetical protein [Dehalococcoidia bacterium]